MLLPLFKASLACKARRLCSEVKQAQIGTLALVQLGDPPPGQIWRCVHMHVLMLLHNHAVDHETSFELPLACEWSQFEMLRLTCECVCGYVDMCIFPLYFHPLLFVWDYCTCPPVLQPSLPLGRTTYHFPSFQLSDSALTHLWSLFNHFPPCCSDTPEPVTLQGTLHFYYLSNTVFCFLWKCLSWWYVPGHL